MFRGRSIAAALAPSSPSQFSGVSAVALLCCVFLAAVPIERVACMSLDRLGIDRNEIQNEKQQEDYKIASDVVVDDRELAAVPAVGNTDVYVLMPAGSVSDLENVDRNTIENVRRDEESSNAMEDGSDMVMMESNDAPVMQMVQMPESSLVDEDQYKTVSIAGEMEPEEEIKKTEVPAEEYSGHDVFPQDIAKEHEEDTAEKGTASDAQNEMLNNLSMLDLLQGTAINKEELPLEMPGSAPLDSASAATTNDEHLDNESVFEFFPDAVEAVENVVKLDNPSENFDVEKDKIEELASINIAEQSFEPETIAENVHVGAQEDTVPEAQNVVAAETAVDTADLIADSLPEDSDDSAIKEELTEKVEEIRPDAVAQQSIETIESENVPEIIASNEKKTEVEVHNEDVEEPSEPINGEKLETAPMLEEEHTVNERLVEDDLMQDVVLPEKEQSYEVQTYEEEQSEEIPMQIPVVNQEVLNDKIGSEEVPTVDAEEGYKVAESPTQQDKQENEIEQVEESSTIKKDIVQADEEQKNEQGEGIDISMAENLNKMQDASSSDNGQKESNMSKVEIEAAADTANMPMESILSVNVEDKIEAEPVPEEEDKVEASAFAVDESLPEEENKNEAASIAADEPMPEEEDKIEAEPVAAIEPMLQEKDKIDAEPVPAIEPMLQEEDKIEAEPVAAIEPMLQEEDKIEAEPVAAIEPMLQEEDKIEAEPVAVIEPMLQEEDKIEAEPVAAIEPMLQEEDKMEAALIDVDEPMPEEEDKIEAEPVAAIGPMLQEEDKMEAASITVNEPVLEEQALDLQPAEVQEELKPVEIEADNKVPAQIIMADEPVEDTLDKVVAEITEHAALLEPAVDDRMPDEMQVNDQKITLIDEMENTQAIAAEDMNSNSILTTIVQVPQVELQAPQQTAPLQSEQVQTTAEESSAPAEVHNENEAVVPAAQEPAQVATESSTQRPFNVADSVLNYVNASFSQQTHDNQASPSLQQQQLDDGEYSSQLRRYDGAQVWRIVVQTDRDRKLADELQAKYDGQLWKEVKQEVDYLLKPQVLADAELFLRGVNLSRIVLIDNLQKVIEVENPPADQIAQLQNRKGHRLTWQAYHRLEDIHGFIDYLAKTYPDICSVETIGYSTQKRPLKILKISNGNKGNPGIWIDGGMHAREWISPASVTYIANEIVEGWDDLPAYMKNINWYIHAVANPDGYEYSHTTDRLWRKNLRSHGRQCPGVDLNRNFGYKWGGKGTSANPCSQTYRGNKAFSEPETFYISKFISNYPRDTFQAYLTFHSYGQYILYPWGYDYALTNDRADLDRVARQAGTSITRSTGGKYTVGSSALTLYPAAGGSDDWAKGFAGIKYAYTIEMGDTGRYGFVLPASHIEPNGKDGYTFVETVARAVTQTKGSRRRAF